MSELPRITGVLANSPAADANIAVGDEILEINGESPRDIIHYQLLVDEPELEIVVRRGGITLRRHIVRNEARPLGIEIHSAVFDRIRTCDNHCEFCFIYQLPKGMRRSLYVKDDDYRLSFLYGNFTTLTRFTEADLERVITEKLSPLFVSIHATDPDLRAKMLRNPRGATSLRWLRALLDHNIDVHGQIVVCPDVNNGDVLDDTLAGVLDQYPELKTIAAVPLGVSRFTKSPNMRPHTQAEAQRDLDIIHAWQEVFLQTLGRRMIYAADEYYLRCDAPFPDANHYDGFDMYEDGIGMAAAFSQELHGNADATLGAHVGFFQSVDVPAVGYRAPRQSATGRSPIDAQQEHMSSICNDSERPIVLVTGELGGKVLDQQLEYMRVISTQPVELLPIKNNYFGGNIGVTGLLTGTDIRAGIAKLDDNVRVILPDVCLSNGRFLDDTSVDQLGRSVEVIQTDGTALRKLLTSLQNEKSA